MKFWAYINGEAQGPFEPEELKKIPGFGRGTIVYPENLTDGTADDWKPAFQVPEIGQIPFTAIRPPMLRPISPAKQDPVQNAPMPERQNFSPASLNEQDIEKKKLYERIMLLEDELEKSKREKLDISNLNLLIKQKDAEISQLKDKIYELREQALSNQTRDEELIVSLDEEAKEETRTSKIQEPTKKCPSCLGLIHPDAKKCKHCGKSFEPPQERISQTATKIQRVWHPGIAAVLSFFFPGVGQIYKGQIVAGLIWLLIVPVGYMLLIIPGVILHICCIGGAYSSNPTKSKPANMAPVIGILIACLFLLILFSPWVLRWLFKWFTVFQILGR